MSLFKAIQNHALNAPNQAALKNGECSLSYEQLITEIQHTKQILKECTDAGTMALAMENHPAWAVIDIAASENKTPIVPIPAFFSDGQIKHAIADAGAGLLITDNPKRFTGIFDSRIQQSSTIIIAGKRLMLLHLNIEKKELPHTTAKITYTSGTTGQPKGVCLSDLAMLNVAKSIQQTVQLNEDDQHLCVLPLSTLLENVAGLYATLLAGGTAHVMSSEQVGLSGSSLNVAQLQGALQACKAKTAIFIPELLSALVASLEKTAIRLPNLRFLAVGGASVAPQLLTRAHEVGLPVFEGYGLSESASVVALNCPVANKIGSVGKLLPHVAIQFSPEHEILLKGANYLGYSNAHNQPDYWVNTGDIGFIDDEGYLFISGRKKNIFITSYGRNVSPEWVERDLTSSPIIAQACLFGEAKPWNTALIVPTLDATEEKIALTIRQLNKQLPDYARVKKWLVANEHFSVNNQQLTPNGRLKRDAIWQQYEHVINALYA